MKIRTQLVGGSNNGTFRGIDHEREIYEAPVYAEEGVRAPEDPPKNDSFRVERYTRRVFIHESKWVFDIIVYGIEGMSDDDVWRMMK